MNLLSASIIGIAMSILTVGAPALAAKPSLGQQEYETHCAMCHGLSGSGDGWLAGHLMQRIPPITRMQRSNGGVFPFERTYEIIDGRTAMRMHGPRTMPVWGEIYRAASDQANETSVWRFHTGEQFVRARILALIEYISQLQE